eukprot:m.27852 g.27852  ORF g.27852 m.27852 type:complete len:163 (-) comp7944_c0_seq2:1116-1604(-)
MTHQNNKSDGDNYNILRETELRLLGYANELGEAFKHVIPRTGYFGSYAIACTYCAADAVNIGLATSEKYSNHDEHNERVRDDVIDTVLWQGFASVAIPGLVINRIVSASRLVLANPGLAAPQFLRLWGPTSLGIAAIPFIVKPIDSFVDFALDNTYREWVKK